MDALVAGAAPEPGGEAYYARLLAAAPFVIAADAAAEWALSLGRVPDLAVGDFDSSRPGAAEHLAGLGVPVVRHPAAKDASDLDLAVAEARARGFRDVTLTAVTSCRLDHTLAALGTLAAATDLGCAIDEPSLAAWALAAGEPPLTLAGPRGALVSVFAVGGPAEGVDLAGMRFPLHAATLPEPSSLGLSNELAADRAVVTVARGRVVVLSPGSPEVRACRL